ncbi:MAG: glycosyltransferase, partial [Minisyncoccales bacterium]
MEKKIYFLINSLSGGGAERTMINISRFLKPEKIFLLEKEVSYPTNYLPLFFLSDHKKKTNLFLKIIFFPLFLLRLKKIIKKEDTLLSFLEKSNVLNLFLKIFLNHRALISIRNYPSLAYRGKKIFYRFFIKFLYPKADLIIAISLGIKKDLIKNFSLKEEKIKVIYNGIDFEEIEKKSKEPLEEFSFLKNKRILINVARLTKQKGQWYLLRIFKELKKDFSDLKLCILGEGELKDYLVALSEKLRLKTFVWDRDPLSQNFDVYFLGFQKNPFKFLANSKIFLLTSFFEGLSSVVLEAMACGLPIMSSDCQAGPREILAPESNIDYQTQEAEFG